MLSKGAASITDWEVETFPTKPAAQSGESVHHHLDDIANKHIDSGRNKQWFQYSILMKQCFQQATKKA